MKVVLIFILILGILTFTFSILKEASDKRTSVLRKILSKSSNKGFLDKYLDKIKFVVKHEEKVDDYLRIIEANYTARKLTKYRLLGIYVGLLSCIYMKNILIVLPMTVIFSSLPTFIIGVGIERKQLKFNTQLTEAIQLFNVEYCTTQNVNDALFNILPKLKKPIKHEFERLFRKLNSGEKKEDCFLDFARRVNNKNAMIFAQLMITYYKKGGDVSPHISRVVSSMFSERKMRKYSKMELSGIRTVNIITNACVPVAYIANRILNPESTKYFTDTNPGRFIIFIIVTTMLGSLFIGEKISKVKI